MVLLVHFYSHSIFYSIYGVNEVRSNEKKALLYKWSDVFIFFSQLNFSFYLLYKWSKIWSGDQHGLMCIHKWKLRNNPFIVNQFTDQHKKNIWSEMRAKHDWPTILNKNQTRKRRIVTEKSSHDGVIDGLNVLKKTPN